MCTQTHTQPHPPTPSHRPTHTVKQCTQTLSSLPGSPEAKSVPRDGPLHQGIASLGANAPVYTLKARKGGEGGEGREKGGGGGGGGGERHQAGNSHTVSSTYMHTPQWHILTRKPQITWPYNGGTDCHPNYTELCTKLPLYTRGTDKNPL